MQSPANPLTATTTRLVPPPSAISVSPAAAVPTSPNTDPARSISTPALSTALTPGTTLGVRVIPPTEAATPGAAPMKGVMLPAIVTGALPHDRLIVDTPLGRIAVNVPPALASAVPGTALRLEWFPETTKPPLLEDDAAASATTSRSWPVTRQVVHALLDAHDPLLRQAAEALIPKPGPRLAQQIQGFLGRGDGDLSQWLGDQLARQLEALDVTERALPAENSTSRAGQRPSADGEWRHVTMPLFDGQMLRPIEIHARRRRDTRDDRARDQSRFVVECEHDELGALQIDGLMTSGGGKRRLDVILRSHAEMPADDRTAIGALFTDACGAMGLAGDIVFQTLQRFPLVAPDLMSAHRDVVA